MMSVGMLWFDNDPKSGLTSKIERAANYYRNKYGKKPTLCFVHPSMIPPSNGAAENGKFYAGGIEVRANRSILPNHLWLGVNGMNETLSNPA